MNERNDSASQVDSEEGLEGAGSNTSIELSSFFDSTKDAIERHNHCPICHGNLHFTHATDFSKNLTHEAAQCPECGIRIRQIMHRLQ